VRLVQLTDLHLNAAPRQGMVDPGNDELFRLVLAHAATAPERPDVLVLTGDLVHDGAPSGYRRLAHEVRRHGLRACALPGNHDDPEAMADTLGAEGVFCGTALRLGGWSLVLLDTHLPGTDDGELGEAQLSLLEGALGDGQDTHVLIALHHHPVPVGSRWIDAMGLRDAPAFWSLIAGHPRVRGVLCGHVHQEHSIRRGGIPTWTTPATCRQFAPHRDQFTLDDRPPGYRCLALHPDGRVETSVVRVPPPPRQVGPTSLSLGVPT